MKYLLISLLFVLCSCKSPVQEIAKSANTVQAMASSSKERFLAIDSATRNELIDVETIQDNSAKGVQEQETIIELTKNTLVNLTKVEDKVPWWSTLIVNIMIGLSILGGCFMLWYLGIGHLTKALFIRLGWISSRKMDQASLLSEALDKSSRTTVEEAVAVLRSEDPELNQAFKKLKKTKPGKRK